MSSDLGGKVAIITGAGRGQGEAHAHALAEHGAHVIVTDVLAREAAAVADDLGSDGTYLPLDVSDEAAWATVVESVVESHGRIDILVNNAGVCTPTPLLEETEAAFMNTVRINQLGTFLGIRAVAPTMIANGGGSIINVSSGAGLRGGAGVISYASTKWAVRGISKAAAQELAPNVRVNCIVPGLIDTPILEVNERAVIESWGAMVPLGRIGRPEDICGAVVYLASDASQFVTGAEIIIDGGSTI